jgi:hypothetical protein
MKLNRYKTRLRKKAFSDMVAKQPGKALVQ